MAWQKNIYAQLSIGAPDGGAHVTASDLDRFVRQVKAGDLLSTPSVQALFTPQVLHHTGQEWKTMYGYGIEFAIDESGHILFAEKEGMVDGVSAVLRHYPDLDINVVLLSNTKRGVWEPVKAIHRLLMPGERAGA